MKTQFSVENTGDSKKISFESEILCNMQHDKKFELVPELGIGIGVD